MNMKKYFSGLLLLTLLVFGFSSCKNNAPVAPVSDSEDGMIPFKVGNNWTWNITQYDETGKVISSHLLYEETVRDTMINGEKWFLQSANHSASTYPPMTNRGGATYTFYNGNPTILFNTVIEDTSIASSNANQSYFVSKNNLIQVPYGKFTCNKYQVFLTVNDKKNISENYYLGVNKGMIKSESFSLKSDGTRYVSMKTELVSTNVF